VDNSIMLSRSIALLILGSLAFVSSTRAQDDPNWTRSFPPFRIIGNIYWVGSYDLSSYLITTPQGHILINTGVGDTARQIKAARIAPIRMRSFKTSQRGRRRDTRAERASSASWHFSTFQRTKPIGMPG